MKKTMVVLTSSLMFLTTISAPISNAVYGGEEDLGTERVVAILDSRDTRGGGCSGALLTPRIVLSAAHCFGKPGKFPGVLKNEHWGFWISQPGVNLKTDDISTRIQSAYVVFTDNYTNYYDPKNRKESMTDIDDIAFIFLSKPINLSSYPKIASSAEVKRLKAEQATITHYGYGLSDQNFFTGKPKKVELKIRQRQHWYETDHVIPEDFSIITNETGSAALCGGDSGGPWYSQIDGKFLIVANTVGASGCHGPGSGTGGTFGTLVHNYESLLWKKWEYFLANEKEIMGWESKSELMKSTRILELKHAGQYYQEQTACHSQVIAALQSNKSGAWQDVAPVEGWIKLFADCEQPWTAYRAIEGEKLRWRLKAQGEWEVFTEPIVETTSTIEKANDAVKGKTIAVVESITATQNILTIKCIRGKVIKRVTSKNPKCPKGYKKVAK
jgi:hypothetical protein